MNTVRVMSKNAAYQKFEVLRTNRNKRYRYGEFLVEGVRNINQAIRNGWQFTSLLYSPETPLSRWAQEVLNTVSCDTHYQLSANLMQELSGKTDTSELLATLRMRPDDPALLRASCAIKVHGVNILSAVYPLRPPVQSWKFRLHHPLRRRAGRGRADPDRPRGGSLPAGGDHSLHGLVFQPARHPHGG